MRAVRGFERESTDPRQTLPLHLTLPLSSAPIMTLPEIAGHELQELIGSGSCGAVYRAKSSTGEDCAIKVFGAMAINRQTLNATLLSLQHLPPHHAILRPLTWRMDIPPYFCSMPLLGRNTAGQHDHARWETGTLEHLCLTGMTTIEAWQLIYELADAIAWLHLHHITHGNLRPCNILLTDDTEGRLRLSDAAQGWVGGVYHLELGDHYVYLCPEQAEDPTATSTPRGQSWDAYSFGVIAYRLLTGQFPRANELWEQQIQHAQKQYAAGLAYQIDGPALLQAVKSQTLIHWPTPASSTWETRRREIIERALSLDPLHRWPDLREVMHQFKRLEADYLLAESQSQTTTERTKQSARVRSLRQIATALTAGLTLTTSFGIYTWWHARSNEKALAASDQVHQADLAQHQARSSAALATKDQEILQLTQEREGLHRAKSVADLNLKQSQTAVDRFLTQLLQTPTSNELEVEFSKSQMQEALAFLMQSLTPLESRPDLAIERARTYGNIGQIHLKLHDQENAEHYLQKARAETTQLIATPTEATQTTLCQQWLGRYELLLSDLHRHNGDLKQAYQLLQEATANLQEGLAADPKNRLARNQCARACTELGLQAFDRGDLPQASQALDRASQVLDPNTIGSDWLPEEAFMAARLQFIEGRIQEQNGQFQDALTTMIDSVRAMGQQVMGSSPRNQNQALELASSYTLLAELVGLHFNTQDALDAHQQAVPILLELNRLHPDWPEVKYLLARNDGAMAQLERDLGQVAEATRKKQNAIELINEILADFPDHPSYRFLQAKLRGEYASFLADSKKFTEAVIMVKPAISSLETLLQTAREQDLPPLSPDYRNWVSQLAQCYGVQGHSLQNSAQKDAARTAFTTASTHWQQLATDHPNDEIVKRGLAWVKDRIQKLQ